MTDGTQNVMECGQFERLLTEALDGALSGASLAGFEQHRASCPACRLLFAEARAGMRWLHALEAVEPPSELMERVLAATSGLAPKPAVTAPGWLKRMREWNGGILQPVLQPRFAMSFAMAFFSVSLVLSMAGVRWQYFRLSDLEPSSLRDNSVRTYYETQARVVKYYENLRLVYEIESRVRELKSAPEPESTTPAPKPEEKKTPNDKSSGEQEPKSNQRYRQDARSAVMARLITPAPAMARPVSAGTRREG